MKTGPDAERPPEEILIRSVEVSPAVFREVRVPTDVMLVCEEVRRVPVIPFAEMPEENVCNPVKVCEALVRATLVRLTEPVMETSKSAARNEATPVTLEVAKGAVYCVIVEATVMVFPVCVIVIPAPFVIETAPVMPLTPVTMLGA